jgi:F420-non-reducing hydrogenase iron-sulfur subunit
MNMSKPKIVCFSCKFSWAYLGNEDALAAQIKNWVPIICAGKLDASYIADAFINGADGVLILGCPEGDCHFQDGNIEARKRMILLRQVLKTQGVEPERLRMILDRDPEATSIPGLISEFAAALGKLEPIRKKVGVQ